MQHACASCGNDLSRLRAPPDPSYHLRIVVCPRCSVAVARVRPRVEHAARQARRALHALVLIACQAFLAGVFALAIVTPYFQLEDMTRRWRLGWGQMLGAWADGSLVGVTRGEAARAEVSVALGFFAAASIGAGVWLASALAHWRRWQAHLALAALVAAVLLAPAHAIALRDAITGRPGIVMGTRWPEQGARLAAAVLASGLAIAGAPPGRILLRVWRRQAAVLRSKWRRKRRKARGANP